MAYIPMDLRQLDQNGLPRADIQGNFQEGMKSMAQLGALSTTEDPMERYRMMFGISTPREPKQSVFAQRQQVLESDAAKELLAKYKEVSESAIKKRMEDKNANISSEMIELGSIANEYRRMTQQVMSNEMTTKTIDEEARLRKAELSDVQMKNKEEEEAYKAAISAFDTSIGKVKDASAQLSKVWKLLDQAAMGNVTSAKLAAKTLVQSIDNSAVMAGEMNILNDESWLGKIKSFLNTQATSSAFTAKELSDMYQSALAISDGVNEILSDKAKGANAVYAARAGENGGDGGKAIDAYVSTLKVKVPSSVPPAFTDIYEKGGKSYNNGKPTVASLLSKTPEQKVTTKPKVIFSGDWK